MLSQGIYHLQKTLGLGERYYKEYEDESNIIINLAIPGATRSTEFKITINRYRVKIVFEGNDFCNSFLYIYPLADRINKLEATADLDDGILTVVLPKIRKY